jgi:hypothetical protein
VGWKAEVGLEWEDGEDKIWREREARSIDVVVCVAVDCGIGGRDARDGASLHVAMKGREGMTKELSVKFEQMNGPISVEEQIV